jgi:hypothetical protein
LNHCENAIAASNAGVIPQLHPGAGIDSARLLLFSGDALSYVSFATHRPVRTELPDEIACSAASLLYPYLGGPRQPLDRQLSYYSEDLPMASGRLRRGRYPREIAESRKNAHCGETLAQTQETPPLQSGVSVLPHLSLASLGKMKGGGCLHRSCLRLPDRLLPFEGRSLAVALVECLVLLGLAGRSSSCRYITGAIYMAIGVPFSIFFIFNQL